MSKFFLVGLFGILAGSGCASVPRGNGTRAPASTASGGISSVTVVSHALFITSGSKLFYVDHNAGDYHLVGSTPDGSTIGNATMAPDGYIYVTGGSTLYNNENVKNDLLTPVARICNGAVIGITSSTNTDCDH